MEAPENIYLFENPINGTPDYRWLSKRSCSDDVEYTRTDAFIEKACKWINEHTSLSEKLVIENFRRYMKGE